MICLQKTELNGMELNNGMVGSKRRKTINEGILAGHRRCDTFEFRYLRLRAERTRKISKTISATINHR